MFEHGGELKQMTRKERRCVEHTLLDLRNFLTIAGEGVT
jgi:hypothetical protein